MAVLLARSVEKTWGDRWVLRGADLRVDPTDRVGLVGANGTGKSTLMQILAGIEEEDSGDIHRGGSIAVLMQRPQLTGVTVGDAADAAIAWHAQLLQDYEAAMAQGDAAESARLQDQLDHRGWAVGHQVASILDRVGAPPREARIADLSGGERRRVALATTLLQQPDLLLLDEPTNHLDADAVEWLQGYLQGYRGAVLLVTHDRYLLESVAQRIVEVEMGLCVPYDGTYGDYLVQRAERHARIQQSRGRTLQLIAQEAAWAARSPSARTTKQKARLQRLDALRESVPELEQRSYTLRYTCGIHKGTTLLQGRGLTHGFDGRTLMQGLDFELRPGERLGIIGPNGIGKSTLLKLVTGELTAHGGTVERYSRASVGVLDQGRTGLKPDDTVIDAVADGRRHVEVNGKEQTVQGFLGHFAFPRDMFEQRVANLSGGERARLLLARLMLQNHAILLLDEPTNDLDLLTLRVLEDALLAFDGGVLVVTHDRAFLDRVCTGVLQFEPDGRVTRYASRLQAMAGRKPTEPTAPQQKAPTRQKAPAATPKKRLSYKERHRLEALPGELEALEQEQAELEAKLADPATYKDATSPIAQWTERLEAIGLAMEERFAEWEALEARA